MTDSRPLGPIVDGWTAPPEPAADLTLTGRYCHLRPIDPWRDAPELFDQMGAHPALFDYLFEAPPASADAMSEILRSWAQRDAVFLAICLAGSDVPLGYACLMNSVAAMGNIEIGNVNLGPELQMTPAATEAFFLLIDHVIDLGFRRVVWKCNALNCPSRKAAQRLGFSYEGTFRNHLIIKGRNRDTAWFSVTNDDWIGLRPDFETWLAPENFDEQRRQRLALSAMTAR